MPSSPTRLFAALLACATLPNLLRAAELLNGVPVEVLARSTVEQDGRKITFVRIRPPALPPRAEPAPTPVAAQSDSAALAEEARLAAKPCVDWQPTILVHLRPPVVSELRFQVAGREVTVWTNVDFRALASVSQWESTDTVYSWFPMISDLGPEEDTRPPGLGLSPGPAEYVIEATAAELAAHEADLAPLDAILAYHDLNRDALRAEQTRRDALAAAQEAERARRALLPPPKPKDETIYFWKNETPTPMP